MTTVWLWDADGPARSASGVTDDAAAAKDAALMGMITTGAATATVEQATHQCGGGWLQSGYSRTGTGWTAERHGNRIRWTKLHRPQRAALLHRPLENDGMTESNGRIRVSPYGYSQRGTDLRLFARRQRQLRV